MTGIPEHLAEKIRAIPMAPGIYQMKDIDGNILYVGKSKNLRTRVRSYFITEHEAKKLQRLVFNIADIDYIVTDTHLEARLLECELIKKLQPMYNVQFRNDKKYKYLKVEETPKDKPLAIVKDREGDYCFGPYKSQNILFEVTKFFENIYPISKEGEAYAFTYHALPSVLEEATFEENKTCLLEVLSNKGCMERFLDEVTSKMNLASEAFQFERAALYRDMLHYIKYLYYSDIKQMDSLNNKKVLVGERIGGGYKLFYIATGRILFKKKYKRLSKKSVELFVSEAKEIESKSVRPRSEKKDLDFRHIIRSELQDNEFKEIKILDDEKMEWISEFIKKLKEL